MRVAQVIGKLAAAGVEAVVNNYYCSMNTERIQFDYFIDEDSELAPPQEMIDRGARYFVVPSTRHAAARVRALTALFRENHYAIVHAHMNTLNLPVLYAAWRADVPVRISHNHSAAAPEEKARTLLKLMLRPTAGWFATDRMACGEQAAVWMFGKKRSRRGASRCCPTPSTPPRSLMMRRGATVCGGNGALTRIWWLSATWGASCRRKITLSCWRVSRNTINATQTAACCLSAAVS
ncbi:MAG: glycosyltransferase [Christensenellales bacterium]